MAKSKVSPPTSPAGSSQPASVNCPASHVYDGGQQAMLDLGGQRERNRALAPLEEVGEPAVGDDDVGEGVRGERDIGHGLFVRRLGEAEFEHADGFSAVGHRREQAGAVRAVFDARPSGWRAHGRAGFPSNGTRSAGFAALSARGGRAAGVAEPDERLAAEVCDEKGNLARAERAPRGARRARRRRRTGGASSTAASSAPRSSLADGRCGMRAAYGRSAAADTVVGETSRIRLCRGGGRPAACR